MNIISMLVHVELCSGLALTLAGCMSSTPVYDKHFDETIHTVRVMQTLNPNAPMSNDPVSGVDGRATTSAMNRYNTQHRTPQSDASVFTVDVSPGNSLGSVGK